MLWPIVQPMIQKAATGEVSLWAVELANGLLPPVCAKSGRPAEATIRVQYQNNPHAAWAGLLPGGISSRYVVKGRLPMTIMWIAIFTTSRMVILAAAIAFGYGLFAVAVSRQATPIQWVLMVGGLIALQLWAVLHRRLEPAGKVHRDAAGNAWVVLRGVHPNFVAAVEEVRAGMAAKAQQAAASDPQIT